MLERAGPTGAFDVRFTVVFAEDALFVGFVLPGETPVIIGRTVGYEVGPTLAPPIRYERS